MAVQKVKIVSMIGRMAELDKLTVICGKSGVFHPENALSFYSDTSGFSPLNEENPYNEPLQRLNDAVAGTSKRLEMVCDESILDADYSKEDLNKYITYVMDAFSGLQKERAKTQQKLDEYRHSLEDISHFVGLDLNLDRIHECEYIKVRFGSLPKESFEKLKSYTQNPYIIFFPATSDNEKYWGVYFAPIDQVSEVDRIFSSLYFTRIRLPEMKSTPELVAESLDNTLLKEHQHLERIEQEIEKLWQREKEKLLQVYSWLSEKSVCFGIRRYAATHGDNFILTGWIPADREEAFAAQIDKLESVEYSAEDASDELKHSPPVILKNKKPFKPFEFFVDMYGLPDYNEPDPTAFVAITYILLFGIMFGDVGQGIVVSIVGYLMWKFKKMAIGKILIPCGISSTIFGFVFGSVFGMEEALNPLYKALFGLQEKPISVMEPDWTVRIILTTVVIGIVLVLIAMLINIYSSLKRKDYTSGLFGPNGVAGLVFYGSIVIGFGGQLALGWNLVTLPYVICLIILPLIVMMFRDIFGALVEHQPNWKPESWGGFIMENFFELFEFLLSYMSNTISFLRVGAFVLVHAGMMIMVFSLAELTSGFFYILIAIVGNIFVIGMEALLVCIQVMRLEFYEMFSRFFDGAGRAFTPVQICKKQA